MSLTWGLLMGDPIHYATPFTCTWIIGRILWNTQLADMKINI